MFLSVIFIGFGLLAQAVVTPALTTFGKTSPARSTFSKSVSDFATAIYLKCIEENQENIIISPLSIQTATSLLYMGATGTTAEEIATGLKLTGNRETIAREFGNFIDSIQNINSTLLKMANRIYVMQGKSVKREFNEIATKQYHSSAIPLDFVDNVNSANAINGWVEDNTNHKIKDLIKSSDLDADTRMILVNAIYFKGSWEYPFKKTSTSKLPFYISSTNTQDIDMMYKMEYFKYGQYDDLNADAIELPYKNSDLSLFILLPRERDGLRALEKQLSSIDIIELSQKMRIDEVEVTLPKFKIEFEIQLNDVLKKMGMSTMFSNAAEFKDLLESNEPLKVSKAIHKAFIEVNEEGTEAAAATGYDIMLLSGRLEPNPIFKANHPFIFCLKTKFETIFIGRFLKKY